MQKLDQYLRNHSNINRRKRYDIGQVGHILCLDSRGFENVWSTEEDLD